MKHLATVAVREAPRELRVCRARCHQRPQIRGQRLWTPLGCKRPGYMVRKGKDGQKPCAHIQLLSGARCRGWVFVYAIDTEPHEAFS